MYLIALALCLTAPVPREAKEAPDLTPGRYTIMWAGSPYTATLSYNGVFEEVAGNGQPWHGQWEWDKETRILRIKETQNGNWFCEWSTTLDLKMCGKTGMGIVIKITPLPYK